MGLKRKRAKNCSYETKYEIMMEYINTTGKKIQNKTVYNGHNIGGWQNNMRSLYYVGELKIDKELEEKFLEAGILRTHKEKEKKTDEEKYQELIKLANKEDLDASDLRRIYLIKQDLGFNRRKGKLQLSKEQISELTKLGLIPAYFNKVNSIAKKFDYNYYNVRDIINFLIINGLDDKLDAEEFLKYCKAMQSDEEKSFEPIIISKKNVPERTKNVIRKELLAKKDFPDYYVDFDSFVEESMFLNQNQKDLLRIRLGMGKQNEVKGYEEIGKIYGVSHQNIGQIIKASFARLKKEARKDIKSDIYTKLLIDKKDELIKSIISNWDQDSTIEQEVEKSINLIKNNISFEDLCIPKTSIEFLKSKNINSINDLEDIANGNTKLSDEELEITNRIIKECNLDGRTKYVFENLRKDLRRITIAGSNRKCLASIDKLKLPVRASNALKRRNIHTIGDIVILGHEELAGVKYLGEKGYIKIVLELEKRGINIGNKTRKIIKKDFKVNLQNGFKFLIQNREIDSKVLFERIDLYNSELEKCFELRDTLGNIPQEYVDAIKMYQEEKDLIDEDEEKNKVIKEILRKQGIVSRQELRKQELENMQEQEK